MMKILLLLGRRAKMPKEEVIWIETLTGKRVNPLNIREEDICIEDIARPLSRLCRYVGQCSRFYSVGQHCIHVADLVHSEFRDDDSVMLTNTTCLAALLHDGAEAYTNDISRPVKYAIKGIKEMEDRLTGVVMKKFDCIGVDWKLIHKADDILLATEAYQMMKSKGEGWYLPEPRMTATLPTMSEEEVYNTFMERYYRFGGK